MVMVSHEQGHAVEEVVRKENEKLEELSRDPAIYEKLTASVAPSIWCVCRRAVTHRGMEDVKKGLLCMLFGGTTHAESDDHSHLRSDINILLCGDPGTSKSQLLSCVHQIAPRGIYTSGKGSSAVGLTAYVSKVRVRRDGER